MQATYIESLEAKNGHNLSDAALGHEVLKLSDLDAQAMSDLAGMFGLWKEADHCDIDG